MMELLGGTGTSAEVDRSGSCCNGDAHRQYSGYDYSCSNLMSYRSNMPSRSS